MRSDTFEMTPTERTTLVRDLRVAATHFDDDAARATTTGMAEVASVLQHQAREAREIADRLETPGTLVLVARQAFKLVRPWRKTASTRPRIDRRGLGGLQ